MNRCGLFWIIGTLLAAGLLPGCARPWLREPSGCTGMPPSGMPPSGRQEMSDPHKNNPMAGGDIKTPYSLDHQNPPLKGPGSKTNSERIEEVAVMPDTAPEEASNLGPGRQVVLPEQQSEPPDPSHSKPAALDPSRGDLADATTHAGHEPATQAQVSQSIAVRKESLPDALQSMLDNHPHEALNLLKRYEPATQDFFLRLLPVLARLAQKSLEKMSPEEVAVMQEQLIGLLDSLQPRAELVINKMCFCKSIEAFGVYTPLAEGHVFQAGSRVSGSLTRPGGLVRVYVEFRNISSERRDSFHETLLSSDVEIRDARNQSGEPLWKHRFDDSRQPLRSRARLHDYYNNYSFFIPPILPPGLYILTIQVTDETRPEAPRSARRSLEFRVASTTKGH